MNDNNNEEVVQFNCSQCENLLKCPASYAGRQGCCPHCSNLMEIPAPLRALAVKPVMYPLAEDYPVVERFPVAEHYPVAMPVRQEQAGVPLNAVLLNGKGESHARHGETQAGVPFNVTLPRGMGGIQTTVSKGTANSIAKMVVSGLLVALGVIVMAMFGIRRPPRA